MYLLCPSAKFPTSFWSLLNFLTSDLGFTVQSSGICVTRRFCVLCPFHCHSLSLFYSSCQASMNSLCCSPCFYWPRTVSCSPLNLSNCLNLLSSFALTVDWLFFYPVLFPAFPHSISVYLFFFNYNFILLILPAPQVEENSFIGIGKNLQKLGGCLWESLGEDILLNSK